MANPLSNPAFLPASAYHNGRSDKRGRFALLRRATHVLSRHATDVEQQIRNIVGDNLICIFDTVNTDHTLGVRVLSGSKQGTLACIVPGKLEGDVG